MILCLLYLLAIRGLQSDRALLFNQRCGVEEVIALSVQQMLIMPGILLSARYAKMNKAKFPPLINSMLGRQENKWIKLLSDCLL